jgi:hypothetical protein
MIVGARAAGALSKFSSKLKPHKNDATPQHWLQGYRTNIFCRNLWTIHIQNVPSRKDPSQNGPSCFFPSQKVPSPNIPEHETTHLKMTHHQMTQVTIRPNHKTSQNKTWPRLYKTEKFIRIELS